VNRRHLITLLGGAAAWPLAVRAQQGRLTVASPEGGRQTMRNPSLGHRSICLAAAFQKGASFIFEEQVS
jgi:hypothetical protein